MTDKLVWTETEINLKFCGRVNIRVYLIDDKEYVVVYNKINTNPIYCRIHSECFTGDLLNSEQCDCGQQLKRFLDRFQNNNCLLIYVKGHEGRGIGLFNKIRSYDIQKKLNLNTIDSNLYLGFEVDMRNYDDVVKILQHMKIEKIKLVTNNPDKIKSLHDFTEEIISDKADINETNKKYINTKKTLLGHHNISDD